IELKKTIETKELQSEGIQSASEQHEPNPRHQASREKFMAPQDELKNAEIKLRMLHDKLSGTFASRGESAIQGRILQGISTPGLSDSGRQELLGRLPIREGDTLSADSIQATAKAVRDFDEHLELGFTAIDSTHAEVRIFVGGQGWGGIVTIHE